MGSSVFEVRSESGPIVQNKANCPHVRKWVRGGRTVDGAFRPGDQLGETKPICPQAGGSPRWAIVRNKANSIRGT